MTTGEVRVEIDKLKSKLSIVGGLMRCDIGDPAFDGEQGDLLALKALDQYLGDRASGGQLRTFGSGGTLPPEIVQRAELA